MDMLGRQLLGKAVLIRISTNFTGMLSVAARFRGRLNHYALIAVAQGGDLGLRNQCFTADGALLTFGQTGFGAGSCLALDHFLGMAQSRNLIAHIAFAAGASVGSVACVHTGGSSHNGSIFVHVELCKCSIQLNGNSRILPVFVGTSGNHNAHLLAGLYLHANGLAVLILGHGRTSIRGGIGEQHIESLTSYAGFTDIGQRQHAVFFCGPNVVAYRITRGQLRHNLAQLQLLGVLLRANGEYHIGGIAFCCRAAVADDDLGRHTTHSFGNRGSNHTIHGFIGHFTDDNEGILVFDHQVSAAGVIYIIVSLLAGSQHIGHNGEFTEDVDVFRFRLSFLFQGNDQFCFAQADLEEISGGQIAFGDTTDHQNAVFSLFQGDGVFTLSIGSAQICAHHQHDTGNRLAVCI